MLPSPPRLSLLRTLPRALVILVAVLPAIGATRGRTLLPPDVQGQGISVSQATQPLPPSVATGAPSPTRTAP